MAKIDIISGFLGAGKTTLIKKLIKEAFKGEQLVLIENEFGEIGIDGGFLSDAGIKITEMNSGCICCSLVGDFGRALEKVISEYHPDRILIEPSGVGKLSDVIEAVRKIENPEAQLNSFTTVCDAGKCRMYMKNFGEFYNNQVEFASAIIMSHTSKLSEEKTAEAYRMLREKNPEAVIVTTLWDELSGEQLLSAIEGKDSLKNEIEQLVVRAHRHHDDEEGHHPHDDDDDEECCHGHHHHDDDDDEECCHGHHHHDEDDGECCHGHHHHDEDDGECCHGHHHHDEDDGECCHGHHHHDDEECCHGHHHHDDDDGECCHGHHHHDEDDGECCHGHHHHDEDDGECCHGHHHHHHADEIFTSCGFETTVRFTENQIEQILSELENEKEFGVILRAKGIVMAQDGGWIHFDYVPGEPDVRRGSAGITGRLCVIGSGVVKEKIARLFGI